MKRTQGTADIPMIECVNPVRNKWRIRWDVQKNNDGLVTYMEADFTHKPTIDEIKDLIIGWMNQSIKDEILSGFMYNNNTVWLTPENQLNYKAAYDLAVQTDGENLPVRFKFGEQDYNVFKTVADLKDFYLKMNKHINSALEKGWIAKDSIDWKMYY